MKILLFALFVLCLGSRPIKGSRFADSKEQVTVVVVTTEQEETPPGGNPT